MTKAQRKAWGKKMARLRKAKACGTSKVKHKKHKSPASSGTKNRSGPVAKKKGKSSKKKGSPVVTGNVVTRTASGGFAPKSVKQALSLRTAGKVVLFGGLGAGAFFVIDQLAKALPADKFPAGSPQRIAVKTVAALTGALVAGAVAGGNIASAVIAGALVQPIFDTGYRVKAMIASRNVVPAPGGVGPPTPVSGLGRGGMVNRQFALPAARMNSNGQQRRFMVVNSNSPFAN